MIDTSRLVGIIYSRGLSRAKVAKKLGITPKTFYEKMKKGVFTSTEIEAMIVMLDIDSPMEIFFSQIVALKATKEERSNDE